MRDKRKRADYDARPATLDTWMEYLRAAGFTQFGDDGVPKYFTDKKRAALGLPPKKQQELDLEDES